MNARHFSIAIIAAALTFGACGNKSQGSNNSKGSTTTESKVETMNTKKLGDPTGNIDKDAKAMAEYQVEAWKKMQNVTQKTEIYAEKYKNDNEKFMAAVQEASAKYADGNVSTDDMAQIGDPTGDVKKDGDTYAKMSFQYTKLAEEMEANVSKYDSYYNAKGEAESKKYEEAVMANIPADIQKQMSEAE